MTTPNEVFYLSFGLAILSAIAALFVFVSIQTTRAENKQAVILNRFVYYMSLVDFFNALLLSFLLFPSFVSNLPVDIVNYVDDSSPAAFLATPNFHSGWGSWLEFFYILESFFWFTSFCFWFMIAVNVFLVQQTHSAHIIGDLYVHIFCWGLPAIYAFCMFQAISQRNFENVDDTNDDWVIVELEHRAILVVVIYFCLAFLLFGVFLMFKTFCEFGVSLMRQRMTLFVGLSLLIWIPAFLAFLSDHLSYMLISLASMGWVNGIVWISSSRFEPIGRFRCCCGEFEVGDRTYLFANMRQRGVETSLTQSKKRRSDRSRFSSTTSGEYYATANSNGIPAITIVNGKHDDGTVFQLGKKVYKLNLIEEDPIAVDPNPNLQDSLPSIAGSEPVELFTQKEEDEPFETEPEEITPVNPPTIGTEVPDRKSPSPIIEKR